jgi:hypothetical protein
MEGRSCQGMRVTVSSKKLYSSSLHGRLPYDCRTVTLWAETPGVLPDS